MWVLIFGFVLLIGCTVVLIFLLQYSASQNKNDHTIFATYKNSMIGSNLSKIQSSLQKLNQSTSKYLENGHASKLAQFFSYILDNIGNVTINIFKFFWNLRPINDLDSKLRLNPSNQPPASGLVKNPQVSDQDEEAPGIATTDINRDTTRLNSTYKRNTVNDKRDSNLSIEDAKIKTHSTLIIGQESDDEELLGDLNKKNESLIDKSNPEMSKDELFKLEKFTLTRFNQARGYNKLDIALDLAEIYGKLDQVDLQKQLYLWVLNKTSDDDIRHRVVNKLIAN
ncbi:MAG: hypothetical protein H7230_02085 [Candidatus Parcubacteria bacterium]|nr:hypothetical protein [Candidatus Paceibacterota bacterium]